MTSFGMPQGLAASAQPKQISSRLLNMKFMQRAEASSAPKDPSTPSTPSGEPRPKRRRTGDFSLTAGGLKSPSVSSTIPNTPLYNTFNSEAQTDSTRRGINNFDAPGIETEWILNIRLPTTNGAMNNTNGDYDSEDESDEEDDDGIWDSTEPSGRQTYGSFKKKQRKTVETGVDAGITPTSESKHTKKRGRGYEDDDEELSSVPSGLQSDGESEGEVREAPQPKRTGTFDFKSDSGLRKLDSLDFHKAGFNHGFGRQRQGLSGGAAFGSPGHKQPRQKPKIKQKKKTRKTM